jgi:hypothetical protein
MERGFFSWLIKRLEAYKKQKNMNRAHKHHSQKTERTNITHKLARATQPRHQETPLAKVTNMTHKHDSQT